MHLTIVGDRLVEVHGSRRVAAHLHGLDLAVAVEVTVARLERSGLVLAAQTAEVLALARALRPVDAAGWQALFALFATPAAQRAGVRAYVAAVLALPPLRQYVTTYAGASAPVYVYALTGGAP